jgi:predicted enzyme related to lactoylglutathione lyase
LDAALSVSELAFAPECWQSSHMIKRVKFIGIPVADQDRALDFYTQKLNFRVLTDQAFGPSQRWIELSIPGAETGIALFTPPGQEDRIGSFVNSSWEVDDVVKTYETLSANGVEFTAPPSKQSWGTSVIMKDSEGNSIVLSARS